ncbi:MAG: SDR family oxidoreductase [Candidatus Marinimicrobia bacterium]|nr:SDR family oxidoreductase [Candidatus Neomarinimicrobiota bacterium]
MCYNLFELKNKVFAITGGSGVLGAAIARSLVDAGGRVAIMDRNREAAEALVAELDHQGEAAVAVRTDVLDKESIERALDEMIKRFGHVDGLINGAGGNSPEATTSPEKRFFDLPEEALKFVFNLNIIGTIIPSQVFGKHFADRGEGVVLNVSSMNAFTPLTRIPAYSAAKAGVSNFTQWLAVHMAQEYSSKIRVNAIAPGFFLTKQNEFLLIDKETGGFTPRGQAIMDHIPMGDFGKPEQLVGTVQWLLSDAAQYVTGIVVPVDGGFSAFSGV